MKKLRLYLDDERPLPSGFDLLVRTVEEAIELIKQGNVEFISLDSDLGIGYTEGFKVADWIEEAYITGEIKFVDFHPHTGNSSSFDRIMQAKRNVYKHKNKIKQYEQNN